MGREGHSCCNATSGASLASLGDLKTVQSNLAAQYYMWTGLGSAWKKTPPNSTDYFLATAGPDSGCAAGFLLVLLLNIGEHTGELTA